MKRLRRDSCGKVLAGFWLVGASSLCTLIFIQTLLGRYGASATGVWGWVLQSVMPSFSLVASVVGIEALSRRERTVYVSLGSFLIALGLSCLYLLAAAVTVLIQPMTRLTPNELFANSTLFLGPFQGIVSGALAVFFVSTPRKAGK